MKRTANHLLVTLLIFSLNLIAKPYQLKNHYESDSQTSSNKIWHDLVTPNLETSKSFYSNVLGWTFEDENIKGFSYSLIKNKNEIIGGILEVPTAKSSTWITSLVVTPEEMKIKIKEAITKGCKLATNPLKLPGRGKQVILESPEGEEFSFITETPTTTNSSTDGNWIGVELWSSNIENSKKFYSLTFGVSIEEVSYDKKPYWIFKSDKTNVAGMIKNPITNQNSQWVPYVHLNTPANILTPAKKSGGSILLAPNKEVRDGKVAIIQDPNGAIICVQSK